VRFLPLLILAAGCASAPSPAITGPVAVVLVADPGQIEADRQVLSRILGDRARSIGELLRDAAARDLAGRGHQATSEQPPAATVEEAIARGPSGGHILVVQPGRWDLETASSTGRAVVEFRLTLFDVAGGSPTWTHNRGRRTVALRTGEARDIEAFVERVAAEAMRELP
jgi:hypothetical protein